MALQIPVIFNVFLQGAEQAVSRYVLIVWNLRFAAEWHMSIRGNMIDNNDVFMKAFSRSLPCKYSV